MSKKISLQKKYDNIEDTLNKKDLRHKELKKKLIEFKKAYNRGWGKDYE